MASELVDKAADMEHHQQLLDNNDGDDFVSIDLPAPEGWIKKFIPKKSGTPRRNEIVFIAPSGEEIKNKRQLDQYLKSHPSGPSASEFDWGTGDTPRRSARLISKPKAIETPDSFPSWKRQKKSSSRKKENEKVGTDGDRESAEDEASANKAENAKDVEMKGAQVAVDRSEEKKANETAVDAKDVEMKDAEVAIDRSEEDKANETAVDTTSAKAPVENTKENIDEANKLAEEAGKEALPDEKEVQMEESTVESGKEANTKALEESDPDKGEGKREENKAGTDEEQAEVQVPQETVLSTGEEHPDETKPQADAIYFDAGCQEVNNAVEEIPGEAEHAANNALEEQHGEAKEVPNPDNAMEEQAGETKEALNNAMEEQPGETKEASENAIEEQPGETKGAPNNAVEEQPGETKEAPNSAIEEQPLISASRSSVEKDVNEDALPNANNEIEGSKEGLEAPEKEYHL